MLKETILPCLRLPHLASQPAHACDHALPVPAQAHPQPPAAGINTTAAVSGQSVIGAGCGSHRSRSLTARAASASQQPAVTRPVMHPAAPPPPRSSCRHRCPCVTRPAWGCCQWVVILAVWGERRSAACAAGTAPPAPVH